MMNTPEATSGFPPRTVSLYLRLEGLGVLAAAIAAYQMTGGNWWVFAVLLLAPDLSMLGMFAGKEAGSWSYNLAHTYLVPLILLAVATFTGAPLLLSLALIWAAHIGMDRALGYGLKYPGHFDRTHLGLIGKARKEALNANAG